MDSDIFWKRQGSRGCGKWTEGCSRRGRGHETASVCGVLQAMWEARHIRVKAGDGLTPELGKLACMLRKALRVQVWESQMDGNEGSNLTSCTFYKVLSMALSKIGLEPVRGVWDGTQVILQWSRGRGMLGLEQGQCSCRTWLTNTSGFKWTMLGDCHQQRQDCWRVGNQFKWEGNIFCLRHVECEQKVMFFTFKFEQKYQSVRWSRVKKRHRSYEQHPGVERWSSTWLRKGTWEHISGAKFQFWCVEFLPCEFLHLYVGII